MRRNGYTNRSHRLWLQGLFNLDLSGITFSQRLRLEDRFIETATSAALRLRYLGRFVKRVEREGALSLVVYDEVFLALNTGFDQNRFFAGINYRFSNELSLDVGYMWNAVPPPIARTT